ncbi:hypothetical protein BS47DRAFT_1360993 [Hydnum rufescens UP504]|uniref:Uncharacterized protein n=1 Tax=Hydnum rufescens UP504 TaxID=1448309 RepID=A0A9P6B0U8_9AGAM|nr:hypothetical protein BS47DRAFT_1360993 [Hydnum rufescens UP504]
MTNQTQCHTPASAECPDSAHREIQEHTVAQDPNSRLSTTHVTTKQVWRHTPALAGSPLIPYPKKIDEAQDEYNVSSLCVKPHPKPAWTRPKAKYRRTQPSKTAALEHPQHTQQVIYGATPAPAGLWYTIGSPFTAQNPTPQDLIQGPSTKFPTNMARNEIEHHTPTKVGPQTPATNTMTDNMVPHTHCGRCGILSMHETPLDKNTAKIQDETRMCAATHNPIRTPLSKPVQTPPNNPTAMHAMALMPRRCATKEEATMPHTCCGGCGNILRCHMPASAGVWQYQGPPLHDTPPEEYTDKVQGKIQEHAVNQTPTPEDQQAI